MRLIYQRERGGREGDRGKDRWGECEREKEKKRGEGRGMESKGKKGR